MNAELVTQHRARAAHRTLSTYLVTAIGPTTMLAGVVWAVLQPWRITLLHPHGQGFWWLAVEPPLLVVLLGALFAWLVAPGLVEDLDRVGEEP